MYNVPPEDKPTFEFTFQIIGKRNLKVIYSEGSNHQVFENASQECNYIAIDYDDIADYLMQFSFHILLEYQIKDIPYATSSYANSSLFLTGYESSIHYIANVHVRQNSFYKIALNAHHFREIRLRSLSSIYYLSFSQSLLCTLKFNYSFTVVVGLKEYRTTDRVAIELFNFLLFQGSNVYYKTVHRYILIMTLGSPSCSIILSFQLVFVKRTSKYQDTCDTGYLQVWISRDQYIIVLYLYIKPFKCSIRVSLLYFLVLNFTANKSVDRTLTRFPVMMPFHD